MRRAETWLSALRPHYPAAYGSPPCSENAVDGVHAMLGRFSAVLRPPSGPYGASGT